MIHREGESYDMSRQDNELLQCMCCGKIHREKVQCAEDDLFVLTRCDCCKKVVNHLRCGESIDDIYKYYNNTMDERFYNYKTK